MKIMHKNDYEECLSYKIEDGLVKFYFIDMDGKKTETKIISIDFLIGATF